MWSRANNIAVVTAEVRASNLTADISAALLALPINAIVQEIIVGPHHIPNYVTTIYTIGPYATSALAWAAWQSSVNGSGVNCTTVNVIDDDGDFYAYYSVVTSGVLTNRYLLTIVYNISNEPQDFKVNTNGSQPLKVKICEY